MTDSARPKGLQTTELPPLALALEQRFMFDAAGVATGAEVAEQAAANKAAEAAKAAKNTKEFVFIDAAVADKETLIAGAAPDAQVVVLDSDRNGLDQIAEHLADQTDVTSLHIVSHGGEGALQLGSMVLDAESLEISRGALGTIGAALSDSADILLYGCEVATGEGLSFVDSLAELTGADVAASDDFTGAAQMGGDWDLEITTGKIESNVAFSEAALRDFSSILAFSGTITFNTSGNFTDSGGTSLATHDVAYAVGGYTLNINGADKAVGTYAYSGVPRVIMGYNNGESSVVLSFSGGATFNATSIRIANNDAAQRNFRFTSSANETVDSGLLAQQSDFASDSTVVDLSSFSNGITSITITELTGGGINFIPIDDFVVANVSTAPANSAPALGGTPGDATINEDVTNAAIDLSAYNVSDGDGDNVTLTLAVNSGTIATTDGNGTTAGVTISNSGSASMTLAGTVANLNTYLNDTSKVTFTPVADSTSAVTLTVTPNDGTTDGTADTVTINITPQNDAPTLADLNAANFNENSINSTAAVIDSAVTFADIDSTDLNGGNLTVTYSVGGGAEDQLTIQNVGTGAGQIGVSGTTVSYENNNIGTITSTGANGANLVVTFNTANATPTAVDALIQAITYQNTSNTPTASRTVSITVADGDGGTSSAATAAIGVTAENDAPTIATNTGSSLNEGAADIIANTELNEGDPEQSGANITYTITTNASNGSLWLDADGSGTINNAESALGVSGTFTQDDIDNSRLRYLHNGGETTTDSFVFSVSDGSASLTNQTFNLTIAALNDAPTVATNTGSSLNEGATDIVTNTELNEGDPDDSGTGLTYTVTTATSNGSLWVDADSSGTINNAEAALGVNDTFTQDDIDNNRLRYVHNGGETTSDSFIFSLADGGENSASAVTNQTFNFTVAAVNDAPTLTGFGDTVAFTEDGSAVQLDSGSNAAASDAELAGSNYNGATFTMARNGGASADDVYTGTGNLTGLTHSGNLVLSGETIGTVTSNTGGTLTLTFNTNANTAKVTEVIQSLTYSNSSNTPPASVQLDWTFSDGNSGNAQGTGDNPGNTTGSATVNITANNDAPTVATNTGSSLNEGATDIVTNTELNEGDPDDSGTGLTYTVTTATSNGSLWVDADSSGTINNAEAALGVGGTFTQDDIDNNRLRYVHNGGETTSDSFVFSLADGGENSAAAVTGQTFNFTVTAVNDAPTLANLNGDSASFVTGGTAVNVDASANMTITDPDSTDFNTGTLTFTRSSGTANGNFSVDGTTVTAGGNSAIAASETITVSGTDIGTVHATNDGQGGNTLQITFNANATASLIQTLVRNIQFVAPATLGDRVYDVVLTDGDGGTSATSSVTLTGTPNPPVIGNVNGDSGTYIESGSAIALDASGNATLSDADSTDFRQGNLTVSVTANGVGAEDVLGISTAGAVSLSNGTNVGSTVSVSGTAIGTIAASGTGTGGNNLIVTFSNDANPTPARVQTLIQALTYSNSNATTPDTTARTVRISVSDAGSNAGTGTADVTVNITDVNDQPTLTVGNPTPTFVEGDTAQSLFNNDATFSTIESGQTIESMVITVTNVTDGTGANEIIRVDGTNVALSSGNSGTTATNSFGYSVSLTGTTATLTITKSDSTANYKTLVEGLAYSNSQASPTEANRVVTITTVTDSGGTANGGVASNTSINEATTVSVLQAPRLTSATYNATTGAMVVTGSGFRANGGASDIDASLFTFTGEGNATYTLTDTSDVNRTSATEFTLTLSATDRLGLNRIFNVDGTSSKGGPTGASPTVYNMAAADDFNTATTVGNTADTTATVTVSNTPAPTITSAAYNANTNVMTVTGTNFVTSAGATNDIDLSTLTITGEGGSTHTITTATDVEITSSTQFSFTLSGTDLLAVEALLSADGNQSAGGTNYNIAAADNWLTGTATANDIADASNGITVTNFAAPSVTGTTYNFATGQIVVTGQNFVSLAGSGNDVTANLLTITGEGGGGSAQQLTTTANVDVTSATSATLTLSTADRLIINSLLNKDGAQSAGGTNYNLAFADNWLGGAASSLNIADATNGITVSGYAGPAITSATYDRSNGKLEVTASNLVGKAGVNNDIDISLLTLTGGNNETYTLTSAADVEVTSPTRFTITLTGADKTAVDLLMDKNGEASNTATTYNLAAADNWLAGGVTATDISDGTSGITVSRVPAASSGGNTNLNNEQTGGNRGDGDGPGEVGQDGPGDGLGDGLGDGIGDGFGDGPGDGLGNDPLETITTGPGTGGSGNGGDSTTFGAVAAEGVVTSGATSNDPTAGVDAISVVRPGVNGNDNQLNAFYGASTRTTTADLTTPTGAIGGGGANGGGIGSVTGGSVVASLSGIGGLGGGGLGGGTSGGGLGGGGATGGGLGGAAGGALGGALGGAGAGIGGGDAAGGLTGPGQGGLETGPGAGIDGGFGGPEAGTEGLDGLPEGGPAEEEQLPTGPEQGASRDTFRNQVAAAAASQAPATEALARSLGLAG